MNKKTLWIITLLILPIIAFQNCGKSGNFSALDGGALNPSDLAPDGRRIRGGAGGRFEGRSPFVSRSTDTGNADVIFIDPVGSLNALCEKILSCGFVADRSACGLEQTSTVEYINQISAYTFESYEEYEFAKVGTSVEPKQEPITYIHYETLQSSYCKHEIAETYKDCDSLALKLQELQDTTPLPSKEFSPGWFIPLVDSYNECNELLFLYDDYPGRQ